jgi:cell division transport system permease protein
LIDFQPFLVEGVIQGMAGAVLSLGLLGSVHSLLITRSEQALLKMLNTGAISFLPLPHIGAILLGGMILGGLGSLASVGKHSR